MVYLLNNGDFPDVKPLTNLHVYEYSWVYQFNSNLELAIYIYIGGNTVGTPQKKGQDYVPCQGKLW